MDIFEKCYNYTAAREAREQGIYPYFHALESRQDVEVIMEGNGAYARLQQLPGLTTHPESVEAGIRLLKNTGLGAPAPAF
jgi:undecaprenyl pyrophosphate synthase